MEKETNLIPKNSQGQLQKASQGLTLLKNGEISAFLGKAAPPAQVLAFTMKLAIGFPDTSKDFFNLLSEYIVKENFTSERLEYATDYILRTFKYKQLTIADILSIDNRVKVYSYSDMLDYINDKGGGTSDFSLIRISGQAFWVTNQDKARYRLPDEI